MSLTMKQQAEVQALARALQNFLPGSGASHWKGQITFGSIATKLGLEKFYPAEGNKERKLATLLGGTLQTNGAKSFQPLIEGIVREGLAYRNRKNEPVSPTEIKTINGHLLGLGFKFPELWDAGFLDALSQDDVTRAQRKVEEAEREQEIAETDRIKRSREFHRLESEFMKLAAMGNRQEAGLLLEGLLNALFKLADLDPRRPFRITGEQIDGSFMLGDDVYLVEAKWYNEALSEAPLLVFQGKVKPPARGLFIAMNGITSEADTAFRTRNNPHFFIMNGHDLLMVIKEALPLEVFLRRRARLFAEMGVLAPPFRSVHEGWEEDL